MHVSMEEHTFVTVNGLRVKIKMSFIHMHVTSQVGSRKVFILTASDQYELKTRFWLLSQISN